MSTNAPQNAPGAFCDSLGVPYRAAACGAEHVQRIPKRVLLGEVPVPGAPG